MTTVQHGTLMTLAEYRTLDEVVDGVWELVDGVLEQMPPPSIDHHNLITFLIEFINVYLNSTLPRQGWVILGIGVVLSDVRAPTPDFVYVRADRGHLLQGSFVEGIPDLVVEALSGNRARDLVMKKEWYEAAGVPEYWTIDPANNQITVLESNGARYVERAILGSDETLTTRAIPSFALPLRRLFNHPGRILPSRQQ